MVNNLLIVRQPPIPKGTPAVFGAVKIILTNRFCGCVSMELFTIVDSKLWLETAGRIFKKVSSTHAMSDYCYTNYRVWYNFVCQFYDRFLFCHLDYSSISVFESLRHTQIILKGEGHFGWELCHASQQCLKSWRYETDQKTILYGFVTRCKRKPTVFANCYDTDTQL